MSKKNQDDLDFEFYEQDSASIFSPKDELTRRGIYYIVGEIDTNSLMEIHQDILLKHLDPDWNDDLQIIVNSTGGSVAEGMALIDLLDWIRMDVRTIAMGFCASMGTSIACCGTKGKRVITPNTSIMIHGSKWQAFGNKHQIIAMGKEMERDHERDIKFWMKHSKYKTREEVEKHFLHGRNDEYMDATEALEHGIFDGIAENNKIKKGKDGKKRTHK